MRWGLDFEEIIISELLKLAAASSQDNPGRRTITRREFLGLLALIPGCFLICLRYVGVYGLYPACIL